MLLGAITLGQKMLENREHRWKILFIICMLGMLLTYSRTNYLAFFAAISVFFFSFKKFRLVFMLSAGLLILGIVLLPRPASEGARLERLTSVHARVSNATQTLLSMSPKTFLIGEGWYMANAERVTNNTVSTISHSSSPDNSYLHVLQSTGVLGLILFIQLLSSLFQTAKQVATKSSIVAVAVAALFSQTLFYPWVLLLGCFLFVLDEGYSSP
jgi:O-antigen ligase